jgi:hypothetical protein
MDYEKTYREIIIQMVTTRETLLNEILRNPSRARELSLFIILMDKVFGKYYLEEEEGEVNENI